MAGQNIDDTHFQAAEHEIHFIRTAPLAPADQTRVAHVNAERILRSTNSPGDKPHTQSLGDRVALVCADG